MATLSDYYFGDDPRLSQYYLGSGVGATRFNQNYRPTTRFMSRGRGPESLYLNNMGVFAPTQMGDFTPSAGILGMDMPRLRFNPQIQPPRTPVIVEDRMAQDNPNYRAMAALENVAAQAEPAAAQAEPAQEAGAAPRRTLGLLGDMFGGASALDEYMTPEQRAQLQNQGVMAAAMQLLASSGPSRVPVGLGQALGEAYGAGQKGYTAAQQNLLTSMTMKQKMDEYKRARDIDARISGALIGEGAPAMPGTAITPEQAINAPGLPAGPTVARAAMIGAPGAAAPTSQADVMYNRYMNASNIAARYGDTAKATAYATLADKARPTQETQGEPYRAEDGKYYIRLKSGEPIPYKGPAPAAKPEGKPQQQLVDGKVQMVQYYNDGTFKTVSGLGEVAKPEGQPRMEMRGGLPKMVQYFNDGTSKVLENVSQYNAPSTAVTDVEFLTGKSLAGTGAAGVAQVQDYKKSGAVSVSLSTGKEGFKNEFDLSKEFKNEPVYKDFQGMKSALSAVQESLKKENPIGDVAAATKIMKLLDPGSVVRESELGIAMAASGKLDRISNYVDMWKNGTLLTPTQRIEFGALANELYNASARAYNDKRAEYAAFGAKYKIDANTALGNTAPVLTYTPPAAAGAANPMQNAIDAELARRAQQQRGGGMR